jgi:hypothetical protein
MSTQDMNTADALRAILDNLEAEAANKNTLVTGLYINQPEKIAVSSNNAEQAQLTYNGQFQNSFANFTVTLPRPALDVKSIELLSANIPQCQVNIPDESLIFFYYRIKTQNDFTYTKTIFLEQPNLDNIHYIRLLPSYYKQELVQNYPTLGFNKTFNNYTELAAELAKACANDLIYLKRPVSPAFDEFIPNDISITYNQDINKFEMEGNNAFTQWDFIESWNGLNTWVVNSIVTYNNIVYIAIQNVAPTNTAPDVDTSNWQVYTGQYYTYLSAGYEDPNVYSFAQTIQDLSFTWDFDFRNLSNLYQFALYSIPPQPIAQYQTLNLRLGFSWDGIFTWDDNTILTGIIGDVYQNGSIPCMLFNRLRPVPYYQLLLGSPGLGTQPLDSGDPYTATIYTADNFCNLVYSSIINIYTNIIGPSTVDTERNNNLLATVPLACNNLGITFYEPRISNKLTRITKDIYTIYLEFRREDGQPYYFSNNAIITITLGLTY